MDDLNRALAIAGFQSIGLAAAASGEIADAIARAVGDVGDDKLSFLFLGVAVRTYAAAHGMEAVPEWLRVAAASVESSLASQPH